MDNPNSTIGFSRNSPKLILIVSILIIISLACNLPSMAKTSGPSKPVGFVETSIAETMLARDGGDSSDTVDQGGEGNDNAAPPASDTPEFTDTPTLTPTITETPTPEVAMVFSSANTNCRVGPDTSFPAIYTMNEGQEAEAIARGSVGDYWYINIPDQPGKTCAMWGKYATPSGPYQELPVWTPMPTPTPQGMDFKITYHKYIDCGGPWGLLYRIDNVGSKKLQSWQTSATDHTGGSNPQVWTLNFFAEWSAGCVFINQQDDLIPGEAYYLVTVFLGDPKGHSITSNIKICAKDGLAGECLTKSIKHKP